MKVDLDLPEWAEERHIYIMAGIELAAFKLAHESEFHIKTGRCKSCGQCCMNLRQGTQHLPIDEKGSCIHLKHDGPTKRICGLGINRPFPCSVGLNERKPNVDCAQIFTLQSMME